MNESKLRDRDRVAFAQVDAICAGRIDRASVPILGVQNERVVHSRTGVLYQIGGEHFVLTAAHSLRPIVEADIPLYLSMNTRGITPLPLGDAKFCSTEDDFRDIAAIWIPPETACEVKTQKMFLSHNQIDMNTPEHRGVFVFFGYPGDWSGHVVAKDHVWSMGLAFLTFLHQGEWDEDFPYDPRSTSCSTSRVR